MLSLYFFFREILPQVKIGLQTVFPVLLLQFPIYLLSILLNLGRSDLCFIVLRMCQKVVLALVKLQLFLLANMLHILSQLVLLVGSDRVDFH